MPSRQPQPYRKGARPAGPTLAAMLMGRSKFRQNPMDARRKLQKRVSGGATRRSQNRRR